MSRRNSNAGGSGVSLFPFLSILACLIGILTLMIKVISDLKANEVSGRGEEELALAQEHLTIQRQITANQKALEAARAKLKQRGSAQSRHQELEDKLTALRKQLAANDPAKSAETQANLQKQIDALRKQIADLNNQRPALDKKLADLKAEMEARKVKPDNKPPPVLIHPGNSGFGTNPNVMFIECNAAGLVILHRDGKKIPIPAATINQAPPLNEAYDKAKKDPNSMVLFLIRANGIGPYNTAALLAQTKFELRTGKLPVPTEGEIDLSKFFR